MFLIEGKPSIGAHLRAAAIKRSDRYDYRVIERTRERCELEFLERSRSTGKWEVAGRIAMTFEEACKCGLAYKTDGKTLKANWRVSTDDMLFARCISKGYRTYCPDLTGGVLAYDPDELDAGEPPPITVEVIEWPTSAPVQQEQPEVEPPAPISQEQFDAIVALAKDVGFSDDDLADRVMGMFGHRSLSGLAAEEAGRLLKKLKATKAAREKAKQAEPAGAPS